MHIKIAKKDWESMSCDKVKRISKKLIASEPLDDDLNRRRRVIRVEFSDGDHLITDITGTKQEILDYYLKNNDPHDYDLNHPEKTRTVTNVQFLK